MVVVPQQLLVAHLAEGKVDKTVRLEAGGLAGFLFQGPEQLRRVAPQLCLPAAVAQLADDPGRVDDPPTSDATLFHDQRPSKLSYSNLYQNSRWRRFFLHLLFHLTNKPHC